MKLRPEQLRAHLKSRLAPLYLLTGDETLLVEEARQAIVRAAQARGFTEHQRLDVEGHFNWDRLHHEAGSLSLFAAQRLMDIRIPSGKLGRDGADALQRLIPALGQDLMAVVTLPKLDASTQKTKWFAELEKAGVHLAFWSVDAANLPGWIARRAREYGLELDGSAARFLADQVEGNLQAAAQEIEKLALICPPGPVSLEAVIEAVTDSARYSIFDLGEAIVTGEAVRVRRTLEGLRAEGLEPTLVLWSVAREIRILAQAATSGNLTAVLDKARVPRPKRAAYSQAVRRHQPRVWQRLLARCGDIDRAIKGVHPGEPWTGLMRVSLVASGQKLSTNF